MGRGGVKTRNGSPMLTQPVTREVPMKRFIEGEDCSQVTLIPECLDDFIGKTTPCESLMHS